MLEELKNNKKTVGLKQSIKAVETNMVRIALIANDADEKILATFKELCNKNSVDIVYADSMKQLGKACAIDVGAAVVCLLKGN